MSSEDITQPIVAEPLRQAPITIDNQIENSVNQSGLPGTLPSTAIAATSEVNKDNLNGHPIPAALPIASAYTLAKVEQELAEYHEPEMSQSLNTFYDESALFRNPADANLADTSSSLPNDEKSNSDPASSATEAIVQNAEPKTEKDEVAASTDNTADSRNLTAIIITPPTSKKDELLESTKEQLQTSMPQEQIDQAVEPPMDMNASNSSLEMTEKERDLAQIQAQLEKSLERESSMDVDEPAKRSTRGRRNVSASQGVRYDYSTTGTLQNDSEDEDGGWDSDDEELATQRLLAPKLDFGDADANEESFVMDLTDEEVDAERSNAPAAKKQKIAEVQDETIHTTRPQPEIIDDDELEMTGTNGKMKDEVSLVEDDTEDAVSKPRPFLGKVGQSVDESSTRSKSSSKASANSTLSKTPTKGDTPKRPSRAFLVTVDDEENDPLKDSETASKKASAKKSSSLKSRATPSPVVTPESTPSKRTKSAPRTNAEYEEEAYVEEPARQKRVQPATSAPKSKKRKIDERMPADALAKLLRKNAREFIAKYLQDESSDMVEYFTQRHLDLKSTPAAEPPAGLFRRFQFIVTGLRGLSDSASSADFIKLQIKALGGRLVNFRTVNRRSYARRNSLPSDDADLPLCILISEKPQRTLKYINALVNAVPCVHYRWFLACLHQGKILPLDDFLLPAGYNEDAALVPCPSWIVKEDLSDVPGDELYPFITFGDDDEDVASTMEGNPNIGKSIKAKTPKKRKSGPYNYRVEVIGIPAFQSQWRNILRQAGAIIVDRLDAATDKGTIDFVLSDSEPTDLSIQLATARGLPLCTIDWALQTIIQRKLQDPKAKPAYTLRLED